MPRFLETLQTPGPGSPLRKAVLDALRGPVEKDVKASVVFVVRQIRVLGDWAFVEAEPQRPGGRPIDFGKLPAYKARVAAGVFDGPTLYALLRKQSGRWRTLTFVIGPTDVAWADWPATHKAPRAVLPFPD